MKLVTFELKGEERVGCLAGGIIDLGRAYKLFCRARGREESAAIRACFGDMIAFLGDERATAVAEEVVDFVFDDPRMLRRANLDPEDVRLKAPVPRPPKAMICGPSWSSYVKEGRVPEFIFVLKPPTAVVGPGDDIIIPRKARQVATEVELAVVVGKPGRYIGHDEALDHIAGFTVFNDVTDIATYRERTPASAIRAKSYDTFASIGPCVTLRDQIENIQDIQLRLRINGVERIRVSTTEMIYPVAHFVSSVSEVMTLQTGDVISTGCPEAIPVEPGDVVEAEVDGIGVLRNRFVEEAG